MKKQIQLIRKYFKNIFEIVCKFKKALYICINKQGKTMTNTNYTIEKLSLKDAMWYGANQECYIVRYTSGFAPIHEFAALDSKGRYTHNPSKGYIHGNGNTGTRSILLTDISILG